jgi:hypothetical protein
MNIERFILNNTEAKSLLEGYEADHKDAYLLSSRHQLNLSIRKLFVQLDGEFNRFANKRICKIRPIRDGNLLVDNGCLLNRWEQLKCLSQIGDSGGYGVNRIFIGSENSLKDALRIAVTEGSSRRAFITSWKMLRDHHLVQRLTKDSAVKQIADAYLGCNSVINLAVAWRTDPGNDRESLSGDAMMFHFDSDHNRFLKVFVYLDDVDENTGPHMYIPRTGIGRRKDLASDFKRDGRLSDELVLNAGLRPQRVCGPSGTIIFADTHNLHKGKPVIGNKARYIFQLQFVDSLIGSRCMHSWEELCEMNASHGSIN